MLEIRHDPIKAIKVAYATKRQGRTFHPPKGYCPLCPTKKGGIKTEIPDSDYNIVVFENKFPTFSSDAGEVINESSLYTKSKSIGICEVVCYTSEYDRYLEDQPIGKIKDLIKVWADRYKELGSKEYIEYVFIFENKGREVGVTLSHPHGQIYAFSYIPPVPKIELESSKNYYEKKGECLHCVVIENELKFKSRIISNDNHFISFIPYYARWPYEVHLYPIRHIGSIDMLKNKEVSSLAKALKDIINRYNNVFGFRMPYVMVMHQNPTNGINYPYYHFHIEFYPPYRDKNKMKYLAGCELGAGTFINDTLPEEKAKELRR